MKNKVLTFAIAMTLVISGSLFAQNPNAKKPTAYMVADAHLDTQWLWDVQQTIKDYVWNTLHQNLFLLKQYPDYIFNFEGGVKYAWMKEYYPLQYEEMKKYIKTDRWHISGSSWDANEVLICSPESSIRNILLGQTFYRKEFGTEGTDIFLPDCFGFGWTLPTIAAHCGLIGFSSQKLQWRDHPFYGNLKYPFTIGLWKGIDGSTIMMAHCFNYSQRYNNEDLSNNKELQDEISMSPLNEVMRYYGTGDRGGSPTIASVRSIEKGLKGNGPVSIISATSDQVFKKYLPYDKHPELPLFDGELLMDVHGTGCYTSKAIMKLYNRQNEQLGDAAERAAVAADWLGTSVYPSEMLTKCWQRVILHDFHDDITGTSIPRAYEFSWNDELLSLKQFSAVITNSVKGIASRMDTRTSGTPLVLYNAHAYPVSDFAEVILPSKAGGFNVYDANGKAVTAQTLAAKDGKTKLLFKASVPACGYSVYSVKENKGSNTQSSEEVNSIENSVYKVTLDSNGDIKSIYDKKNTRELVKGGKTVRLALFTEDKSYNWPSWEIMKSTIDATPISITEGVKISMVENGPLRKSLCVEKKYGDSKFKQYIRLYEGSRADRIDFYNEIDWCTANALLKEEFPLSVSNEKATYDLGIGSVQRGNNTETAYEVYAQQWADLTDSSNGYGVTILNDCKYGWDKPDNNTIRLSLIHTPSPGVKNDFSFQGHQDMGYHTFTFSLIGHKGGLDKSDAVQKAEILNFPLKAFVSTRHKGDLGKEFSFASSDNKSVVVKAIKKAEVSDEYVVRVYETEGKAQNANITFAGNIEKACEADGTEKEIGAAQYAGKKLSVKIGPFGVKTFKMILSKESKPSAVSYSYLPLSYDHKCASFNDFRRDGNFESGNSYAAELLPDSVLTVDNVPFRLGDKDAANGLTCKGNVIELPKGKTYNKIYFLVASTNEDNDAKFSAGTNTKEFVIPSYTGFIGQWEHVGHTKGFLKDAEVAYVGTHRHSAAKDEPYVFTYMFKYGMDIPKGTTKIVLPNNDRIILFAATLTDDTQSEVVPATEMFRTSIKKNVVSTSKALKPNLLKQAKIIECSGAVNEREQAKFAVDGNQNTKWCDVSNNPNYLVFDFGKLSTISGWKLINAGNEDESYITRSCFLQGRNTTDEAWKTLDEIDQNQSNIVERQFNPISVRYIRLLVTHPTQNVGNGATRIYEFEVY